MSSDRYELRETELNIGQIVERGGCIGVLGATPFFIDGGEMKGNAMQLTH